MVSLPTMATRPNFSEKIGSVPAQRILLPATRAREGRSISSVREALDRCAMRSQDFPLFIGTSPNERSTILGAARVRPFSRGETIYFEGDDLRQVMLLTFGSAKMVRYGEDGSAVILRLCGPGELIGTLGKSLHGKYHCTSQAITSCSALTWDSEAFERLSTQFPQLRLNVAYVLYKLLQDMEDRFREISTQCVACRLSRQVLRLLDQVGIRSNGVVQIEITREELAQLIGTTLYTVSRLLSDWDRRGIVATRREGFSVVNEGSLKTLVDDCGHDGSS